AKIPQHFCLWRCPRLFDRGRRKLDQGPRDGKRHRDLHERDVLPLREPARTLFALWICLPTPHIVSLPGNSLGSNPRWYSGRLPGISATLAEPQKTCAATSTPILE